MKIVSIVGTVIVVLYLGIGLFLYLKQRTFLYFPTPKIQTPYPTMTLQNEGEKIHVIVLNQGHANAILYFGGNAESMAQSSDYIARQFPQFTLYLMDYRGYGESTGRPSEAGIYSDALKLYDTIRPQHERICIGGRSLGSGVATYVASLREVSKLALITPFDSIVTVAQSRYPLYPISWLLQDRYDSVSRVPHIKAKTFIVTAQNDAIIPQQSVENLIKAFSPTQLMTERIKGRGHGDISSDERYYTIMQEFIGEG